MILLKFLNIEVSIAEKVRRTPIIATALRTNRFVRSLRSFFFIHSYKIQIMIKVGSEKTEAPMTVATINDVISINITSF